MTGAWGGVHAVFEDPAGHAITLASVDPLTRELDAKRRADAEEAERDRRAAHELAWRRFCDASPSSAYASAIDIDYHDRRRRLRWVNCGHPPSLATALPPACSRSAAPTSTTISR